MAGRPVEQASGLSSCLPSRRTGLEPSMHVSYFLPAARITDNNLVRSTDSRHVRRLAQAGPRFVGKLSSLLLHAIAAHDGASSVAAIFLPVRSWPLERLHDAWADGPKGHCPSDPAARLLLAPRSS